MKNINLCAALLLPVMLWSSACRRLDLEELSGSIRFEAVVHDEDIVYSRPEMPEMVEINLYDTLTHKRSAHFYMYVDEPLDVRVEAGVYDLMAWSLGSYTTRISYSGHFDQITAETQSKGKGSESATIQPPDQIYCQVADRITIPRVPDGGGYLYRISLHLRPAFEAYCLEVTGIKGVENIRSVTHCITHQYSEWLMATGCGEGSASIGFEGIPCLSDSTIRTEFNTFGMQTDERIVLTTVIVGQDGSTLVRQNDITDQVAENDTSSTHLISVGLEAAFAPWQPGGFTPTAEEWDEYHEYFHLE